MSDSELDNTVGTAKGEMAAAAAGEPAMKLPRTGDMEDDVGKADPRQQEQGDGDATDLLCGCCGGPYKQEFTSPSQWVWWGAKSSAVSRPRTNSPRGTPPPSPATSAHIAVGGRGSKPSRQWPLSPLTRGMPRSRTTCDMFDSFNRDCARNAFRRMIAVRAECQIQRVWVEEQHAN